MESRRIVAVGGCAGAGRRRRRLQLRLQPPHRGGRDAGGNRPPYARPHDGRRRGHPEPRGRATRSSRGASRSGCARPQCGPLSAAPIVGRRCPVPNRPAVHSCGFASPSSVGRHARTFQARWQREARSARPRARSRPRRAGRSPWGTPRTAAPVRTWADACACARLGPAGPSHCSWTPSRGAIDRVTRGGLVRGRENAADGRLGAAFANATSAGPTRSRCRPARIRRRAGPELRCRATGVAARGPARAGWSPRDTDA